MDVLIELLLNIILEPIMALFVEAPVEAIVEDERSRLPKWLRVTLASVLAIVILAAIVGVIAGIVMLAANDGDEEVKTVGAIVLVASVCVLIVYAVVIFVRVKRSKPERKYRKGASTSLDDEKVLGKTVKVVIDRPLGSTHPEHGDIVYGVNYGFVPEFIGGDGEAQDAYVLGVTEPLEEFVGVVTAIIRRADDVEDKWVVVPDGYDCSDDQIIADTDFTERFFEITLVRSRSSKRRAAETQAENG